MDKKKILLANKIVFEFVVNLSEQELKDLLKNNAKLFLVSCKDNIIKNKELQDEMISNSINKLKAISNKEEAIEYLYKFKIDELKKIAKKSSIFVKSRSRKKEIIDRIVEGTIGAEIKMNILKS